MNLLVIIGSPRKGKSIDTLVDKAIEELKLKLIAVLSKRSI